MTTDELIRALRLCSNHCNYHCGIGEKEYDPCPDCPANNMDAPLCLEAVRCEAADRLEELDERVAIMAADMDNEWGKSYG